MFFSKLGSGLFSLLRIGGGGKQGNKSGEEGGEFCI